MAEHLAASEKVRALEVENEGLKSLKARLEDELGEVGGRARASRGARGLQGGDGAGGAGAGASWGLRPGLA